MTLTLTQKCFFTFPSPVWSGSHQVFSYTPPPFHWSSTLSCDLSLPGVLERHLSFGSMSSGAIEAVTAPLHFLHKEGSNNQRAFFIYLTISPRIKQPRTPVCHWLSDSKQWGGRTSNPCPPKHDKIKVQNLICGCYQMQQRLQDDGWLKFALKGWIIQHQQP